MSSLVLIYVYVQTEQNHVYLGSRVNPLLLPVLLNNQMHNKVNTINIIYIAMAMEKSIESIMSALIHEVNQRRVILTSVLPLLCRQVDLDGLPGIKRETRLLNREIAADITHCQKIHLGIPRRGLAFNVNYISLCG